ncbi:hypothetical protein FB480_105191 [Agrobacterium vitis]|nr:hypothetical protein FB480_105191 [Agrobacterium vitis]
MKRTLRKNETVDDLKKPTKGEPYLVADSLIANLFIKVGAKSKHFIMSARFGDSKHPTRRTIGDASLMSLDEARAIAIKWNGLNRQNMDPIHHVQSEEIEKKRIDRLTFRCALQDYICWLPEREKIVKPRKIKEPCELSFWIRSEIRSLKSRFPRCPAPTSSLL